MTGLAESLAHVVAKDRRVAADLLASATAWMHAAVAWSAPLASETDMAVGIPALNQLADHLVLLLAQLLTAAKQVADAGGWAAHAPMVAQAVAGFQIAALELTQANSKLAIAHSALVALQRSGVALDDAARHLDLFEHSVDAKQAVRQAVLKVTGALDAAGALDLPPMLLEPWTQPVAEATAQITELLSSELPANMEEVLDASQSAQLAEVAGQWTTAVMHTWQTIYRAEQQFNAESSAESDLNSWGLSPKELVRRIDLMQQMAGALHLPTMLALCRRLTQLSSAMSPSCDLVSGFVRPWITRYSLMVQHVVVLYANLHKTVVQFALTVCAVMTTVIVHGLGTTDIYDSEETDESNASGTGIGEGSTAGAKNVSDEIEGEDQ
ncbi:hypothetical protein IWW38_005484, partial [Coemansia aciculifera]